MAVALALIALPLRALMYVFKHPKLLIVLAIIIFGIFALRACNNVFGSSDDVLRMEAYQEITPAVSDAPYVLATQTRIYYVVDYTGEKPVITLNKYYIYDQKKWILEIQPIVIDTKYYGDFRFYERAN